MHTHKQARNTLPTQTQQATFLTVLPNSKYMQIKTKLTTKTKSKAAAPVCVLIYVMWQVTAKKNKKKHWL